MPGWLNVRTRTDVGGEAARALSSNANVAGFETDALVQGQLLPNDPQFVNQLGLLNSGANGTTSDADIDADEAWNITTGSSSVVVAVIDSGIDYTHPDLYLNVWLSPGEIPSALRASLIDSDADGGISIRSVGLVHPQLPAG